MKIAFIFMILTTLSCNNASNDSQKRIGKINIIKLTPNKLSIYKQKKDSWKKFYKNKKGLWTIAILRTKAPYAEEIEIALKKSMRKMGHIIGKNIQYHSTEIVSPKVEDFPKTAKILKDIISKNIDIIVTIGTRASVPCWQILKNTTIPMVFAGVTYPIEGKMIEAFNSPTRKNITGISYAIPTNKRLMLIRKIFPDTKNYRKIAFIYSSHTLQDFSYVKDLKSLKNKYNWKFIYIDIFDEIQEAVSISLLIKKLKKEKPDIAFGWYTLNQLSADYNKIKKVFDFFPKPIIAITQIFITHGAFGGVLTNHNKLGYKQALMIHKIINGKFAGDIPPIQPSEYTLVFNLKVAKKMGISINKNLLKNSIQIK